MLSRLPAVSGELITRDCLTMHGGHGCARPAPDSPRCQAGTAWLLFSERNQEISDNFPSGGRWSARGDCEAILNSSFLLKRTESFDKGNSAERQKWNVFFPPRVAFVFLWNLLNFSPRHTYYSCGTNANERECTVTKKPSTSWGSKGRRQIKKRTKANHGEAQCPACTQRERSF